MKVSEIEPRIKDHLAAVGAIALYMAELEIDICNWLGAMLQDDQAAELLLVGAYVPTQISELKKAFGLREMPEEDKAVFRYLTNKVEELNKERSRLIHGRWLFATDVTIWEKKIKPKGGKVSVQSEEPFQISTIEKLCDEIFQLRDDIFTFCTTVFPNPDHPEKYRIQDRAHYEMTLRARVLHSQSQEKGGALLVPTSENEAK